MRPTVEVTNIHGINYGVKNILSISWDIYNRISILVDINGNFSSRKEDHLELFYYPIENIFKNDNQTIHAKINNWKEIQNIFSITS